MEEDSWAVDRRYSSSSNSSNSSTGGELSNAAMSMDKNANASPRWSRPQGFYWHTARELCAATLECRNLVQGHAHNLPVSVAQNLQSSLWSSCEDAALHGEIGPDTASHSAQSLLLLFESVLEHVGRMEREKKLLQQDLKGAIKSMTRWRAKEEIQARKVHELELTVQCETEHAAALEQNINLLQKQLKQTQSELEEHARDDAVQRLRASQSFSQISFFTSQTQKPTARSNESFRKPRSKSDITAEKSRRSFALRKPSCRSASYGHTKTDYLSELSSMCETKNEEEFEESNKINIDTLSSRHSEGNKDYHPFIYRGSIGETLPSTVESEDLTVKLVEEGRHENSDSEAVDVLIPRKYRSKQNAYDEDGGSHTEYFVSSRENDLDYDIPCGVSADGHLRYPDENIAEHLEEVHEDNLVADAVRARMERILSISSSSTYLS